MRYILGIDIGTTAIKAAVIGEDGKVYGEETCEYVLTTMPTGEVEAELTIVYRGIFRCGHGSGPKFKR